MHVVLVHPDIPWNTGNIGRTCVATNTPLHLVKPMGFRIEDQGIKRAGLDYWDKLELHVHESFYRFQRSDWMKNPVFLFSRFSKKSFWQAPFTKDALLIFGSETKGLPRSFLKKHKNQSFRIPTPGPIRSLNLSTAVGIVLFEAIRKTEGK